MSDEEFSPEMYVAKKVYNHEFGISFPQDPRFVNSWDQSKWGWTLYNDWLRCVHRLSEESERCQYLRRKCLCVTPSSVVEKWDSYREEGRWFGYAPERASKRAEALKAANSAQAL